MHQPGALIGGRQATNNPSVPSSRASSRMPNDHVTPLRRSTRECYLTSASLGPGSVIERQAITRDHSAGGRRQDKYGTGPAVKTSNPRLSPRGASAVGGSRARAESPGRRASSSATVLLLRAFMCTGSQKFALARPPARARASAIRRQRLARLRGACPPGESLTESTSQERRTPAFGGEGALS